MPAKKSNKKSTATSSKKKQSASKKTTQKKRASGPIAKAKKAVGKVVTVAGESVTGAVKAVLPSSIGRKKSK